MRAWILALSAVAACGRFDFDRHSGSIADDAAPADGDPGATAADFVAAMTCETDLPIATVPTIDQLRWLDLGSRQVVFAVHHLDVAHHEVHAYVMDLLSGHIVMTADLLVFASPDISGLSVARTPNGALVFAHDIASNMVHEIALDPSLAKLGDTPLPGLEDSFEPYAKSDVAQMIAGVTANGVVAFTIDDAGAVTSSSFVIDGIADGPYRVSIGPFGGDFIVGWTNGAGGCTFKRIDAGGAILAGPLVIATPCTYGVATAIGSTILLAFDDPNGPVAYSTVTDAALATPPAPVALGSSNSDVEQVVATASAALVAVSENMGDSRIASVSTANVVTPLGVDFGTTANSADHQTASMVGGALLHARSEGGVLRIRKLCR